MGSLGFPAAAGCRPGHHRRMLLHRAPADVVVRAARPSEASALSALALRSKGHWGYDATFLAACRADLTVPAQDCDGVRVRVAERGGALLGFARVTGRPPTGVLADLFVEPAAIGSGIGRLLLADALARAAERGFGSLVLDADPHAEPFYLRAGAVRIGTSPSGSVPGRLLPRLEMSVPG